MKIYFKYTFFWLLIIGSVIGMSCEKQDIGNPREIHRPPRIEPDYTGIIIPPNIAPLNFMIQEKALQYRVDIVGGEGKPVEINSSEPDIRIPISQWKDLLVRNRGKEIRFVVTAQDSQNQWVRFDPIRNQIAQEEIDPYLVYRLIDPMFVQSKIMGIYQRNVTNFDEKAIIQTRALNACYNCHSFCNKKPDKMMIHIRGGKAAGTLIIQNGTFKKVDMTTKFNKNPGAYRSWHPSGKAIAFSVNIVRQFFHAVGYTQEGYDIMSDIILYKIDSNMVTTCPALASPRFMETYPEWSPDGRYLYYCRAPQPDSSSLFEEMYNKIMYDLMRISYDIETDTWGKPEIVLSHEKTGLSVTQPRISPDGKYLACAMTKWGTFSIHRPGGDIYLLNLRTGEYYKADVNSDRPESYNSWSSNNRWLVFSSKMRDDFCTRLYFTYIDENGKAHKPFILPQEDPTFYDTFIITYNVPELVDGPIPVTGQEIIKQALTEGITQKAILDPKINLDALTGAAMKYEKEDNYLFR
ncbi:MAG: cytochrome C biosynthesis protein [Bacteroidota bacterium]